MILGHNVQYRGSMSRTSILVIECSKETTWRGAMLNRIALCHFEGIKEHEIG